MANEGTISIQLKVTKGNYSDNRPAVSKNFDVTGTHYTGQVQTIGTTEEVVNISADVATTGWALFKNLDSTNFVEIGRVIGGTFYPVFKLLPGEPMAGRLGVAYNALYAKADTASIDLEVRVYEA